MFTGFFLTPRPIDYPNLARVYLRFVGFSQSGTLPVMIAYSNGFASALITVTRNMR
jgi:hypothetical protein